MDDVLHTDLGLCFKEDGTVDLAGSPGEVKRVSGKNNLVQALKMLLLTDRGELAGLGHTRYGTTIKDFLGEPLTREILELLRRYVRKAIMRDPRVEEVKRVTVSAWPSEPGVVFVEVEVIAKDGSEVNVQVTINDSI